MEMSDSMSSRKKNIFLTDKEGQFAVVDIVLFCIIILLASSAQLYAVSHTRHQIDLVSDIELVERTELTLSVFLRTTINSSHVYESPECTLGFKPISELLIETLYFNSVQEGERCLNRQLLENAVILLLHNLTQPSFGYQFEASLGDILFSCSSGQYLGPHSSRTEHANADCTYEIPLDGRLCTIYYNLALWRV
jgi:hypothetical protein